MIKKISKNTKIAFEIESDFLSIIDKATNYIHKTAGTPISPQPAESFKEFCPAKVKAKAGRNPPVSPTEADWSEVTWHNTLNPMFIRNQLVHKAFSDMHADPDRAKLLPGVFGKGFLPNPDNGEWTSGDSTSVFGRLRQGDYSKIYGSHSSGTPFVVEDRLLRDGSPAADESDKNCNFENILQCRKYSSNPPQSSDEWIDIKEYELEINDHQVVFGLLSGWRTRQESDAAYKAACPDWRTSDEPVLSVGPVVGPDPADPVIVDPADPVIVGPVDPPIDTLAEEPESEDELRDVDFVAEYNFTGSNLGDCSKTMRDITFGDSVRTVPNCFYFEESLAGNCKNERDGSNGIKIAHHASWVEGRGAIDPTSEPFVEWKAKYDAATPAWEAVLSEYKLMQANGRALSIERNKSNSDPDKVAELVAKIDGDSGANPPVVGNRGRIVELKENPGYQNYVNLVSDAHNKEKSYGCRINRVYYIKGNTDLQSGPPQSNRPAPPPEDRPDQEYPDYRVDPRKWLLNPNPGQQPTSRVGPPQDRGGDKIVFELGRGSGPEGGIETTTIDIGNFQGDYDATGPTKSFAENIAGLFQLDVGGCFMRAMYDPGRVLSSGQRRYDTGGFVGYQNYSGATSDADVQRARMNDTLILLRTESMRLRDELASHPRRRRGVRDGPNAIGSPLRGLYVPDVLAFYWRQMRASAGSDPGRELRYLIEALYRECRASSSTGTPWVLMMREAIDMAKSDEEYGRGGGLGEEFDFEVFETWQQKKTRWEEWGRRHFPLFDAQSERLDETSDAKDAFFDKISRTVEDRIKLLIPGYLDKLVYEHNLNHTLNKIKDSRRKDGFLAINKAANKNIFADAEADSTNVYKINEYKDKTTNFYDGIMKKYADDYSDSYYRDAVKGLSEKYTKAYYAGLKGMHDEDIGTNELDYSSHYNVHDETGPDLIGAAHPKSINLADAMGNGGVVENAIESGNRMAEIARNTPTGNYRSRHAQIVGRLNKLADFVGKTGSRKSMEKIKNTICKISDK